MPQTIGPIFRLMSKYLGDQWSVGNWAGMLDAAKTEVPEWLSRTLVPLMLGNDGQIPPRLKEYDPEWARAFWEGTVFASCDHARMLSNVKCPVLYTHHFRYVDETDGHLMGAASDVQAKRVCELVKLAGTDDRLPFIPADAAFDARRAAQAVRRSADRVRGEAPR